MDVLGRLASELGDLVSRSAPAAPAILFLASLVEYVFPPFPGDLLVVLGAWYAVHGAISWPLALVAVVAGAVLGSALDYAVGWWLAPRLDAGAARRGPLSADRLARFTAAYQRWGSPLLVANRFMPALRAFVFVGAGAARIPLARVLLLGGLSAILWDALLLAAGAFLARSLPELIALFRTYTGAASGVLAVLVVALLAAAVLQRRRRRSPSAAGRGEG